MTNNVHVKMQNKKKTVHANINGV